ncbi:BirA-related protein [Neisseria meningitidis]|uniref:BirA-related protein n=1 Tax=Neisseria meningitidis TaxID=487 RepID=A0AAC9GDZ0_NEIME|nr:BirA-related protein [Neisseria meningitidis]ANW92655.1 BirA-related protein [Neisseria meningitidis]ANW94744.1 BirA-related protein [Neisseria meningitidis]
MSNDALPFFAGGCFYIFFNSTDCILEDVFRYGAGKAFSVKGLSDRAVFYSGLNLNQYGVASPCRTICTVCGFVALS